MQGAAPELINSRAAMLGFALAVVAFAKTGKNIFEQIQSWPQPVFAVFVLIAIGTLAPIVRSVWSYLCIYSAAAHHKSLQSLANLTALSAYILLNVEMVRTIQRRRISESNALSSHTIRVLQGHRKARLFVLQG